MHVLKKAQNIGQDQKKKDKIQTELVIKKKEIKHLFEEG